MHWWAQKDLKRFNQLCKSLNKEQGIENLDITPKQREEISEMIEKAEQYEISQHQANKKKWEKQWFVRHAEKADIDIDPILQEEMDEVEEELSKKRKVMDVKRTEFKTVINKVKNIDRQRRNAIFLDPTQITQYANQNPPDARARQGGRAGQASA